MSIWDEPLTKEEYLKRLVEAKAEQRRKDAELPFEEKVEIVTDSKVWAEVNGTKMSQSRTGLRQAE